MRTYVYVDGFNLYYGAVKGTKLKWLDLVALSKHLVPPTHSIQKLKYFTARVSGANDPGSPLRQQIYFSALATLPEVEIHYGRFLSKNVWRRITNCPVAGAQIHSPVVVSIPLGTHQVSGGSLSKPCVLVVDNYPAKGVQRKRKTTTALPDALIAEFHAMEEKGSDVNLAAHLLNDAWKGSFDEAVVISNDTDLVEPIRMVTIEQRKPVVVVCPGRRSIAPQLAAVATFKVHIRPSMLHQAQFPDPIPNTTIRKPAGW